MEIPYLKRLSLDSDGAQWYVVFKAESTLIEMMGCRRFGKIVSKIRNSYLMENHWNGDRFVHVRYPNVVITVSA